MIYKLESRLSRSSSGCVALILLALSIHPALLAQSTQGALNVTIKDPNGAEVPEAALELRDLASNEVQTATSQGAGNYRFIELNVGKYSLTVKKPGFANEVVSPIEIELARVSDITVNLRIGTTIQTVEVTGEATALETSSNTQSLTIDVKQIEDLPLGGRDLTQLSFLSAGYNGTWNGLPSIDQGNNIDGVIGSSSRMKFTGNAQPAVSPRLEDIAEMTVQTDQLDLDQGFGQASMQLNFVTRRGSNAFHGRAYEDFRNAALDANSWSNNGQGITRPAYILNDFGGSVSGHVIKNKLFFFGSYAMSKQPGAIKASNSVLTNTAQSGVFTYVGSDGVTRSLNVLNAVQAASPGSQTSINPMIAQQLSGVNSAVGAGRVAPNADPNLLNLGWLQNAPITTYYPTFRVDYDATSNFRMHVAYNQTSQQQPNAYTPVLPGSAFANEEAGYKTKNYTASLGLDWTISPTVVNSFKGGMLYDANFYSYNAQPIWDNASAIYYPGGLGVSPQTFPNLPVSNYYPVFNASDVVTWQHDKHTSKFGVSWFREQDHYWNPPEGYPGISLGLANGDPALNAFTTAAFPSASPDQLAEAGNLYALLTGDISSVGGQYAYNPKSGQYAHSVGQYNLDERLGAWGVFAQDAYKLRSNLTLNYGLRWDFTGDDYDLTGAYHGGTVAEVLGPTLPGQLFSPGVLNGDMNPSLSARSHQYNGWDWSPQPSVGIAWVPGGSGHGWIDKLFGGKTVIRTGYSLRRFTEPQQYFWNQASDYGSFFYQNFNLAANGSGQAGSYTPGTLHLGQALPAYAYAPASYQASVPEAQYALSASTIPINGMNQNIAQPYTQAWNFGIQRQITPNGVLEVRYNGSHTIHQWMAADTNEVNVFENGFLTQFKAAQKNMTINQQHGITSFADNGYAGQQATPIFNAAFAGEASGGAGVPQVDYANGGFITDLNSGQVGPMALALSGINGPVPYFCNLVGAKFAPCANNVGYTGPGAGYPINFFQANPYAAGNSVSLMDSQGYSNYNAMQVDYRQRPWHGMQFDANYTWSHTLGVATQNQWTAANNTILTQRNLALSYGPTLFDLRHVVHINGTFDLPFGKGRALMNRGGVVNAVFGGWTIGDIFTFQTGAPSLLLGSNLTFNDYGDGGVELNGVTRGQLQSAVGVNHVGSANGSYVDILSPTYLVSPTGGGANPAYITSNTTPGTFGQSVYLYGPHQIFDDMSLSKRIPITERVHFALQVEALNVFNHPTFAFSNTNVQSAGFGTGGLANSPRVVELRANIEF